jgi:uncharacterized protein YutE (UPF0331/DUF86 family)
MKKRAVRRSIIRAKIREIEEGIDLVEAHLPGTFDQFSRLGLIKDGIYKRTEFAIENVFDICAIINTDLSLGMPGEDEDIVDHLVTGHIISEALGMKLRTMKGFRNIVVHKYGTIDDRLAFGVLTRNIQDFSAFISEIGSFLERSGKEQQTQP